jgi:hypothetical protein
MYRCLPLAMIALSLAGCGSFERSVATNPDRTVFGVSAAQQAGAPDADSAKLLDWKTAQTCTTGVVIVKQDAIAAENNQQIVDREIRCRPYQFSFFPADRSILPDGVVVPSSWTSWFPTF